MSKLKVRSTYVLAAETALNRTPQLEQYRLSRHKGFSEGKEGKCNHLGMPFRATQGIAALSLRSAEEASSTA